jgi:hypothetical protein
MDLAAPPPEALTQATLKTPKAAAIAGILFSALLATALLLMRIAVPVNPLEPGAWVSTNARIVALALNLIPFAGIAFLWFIGVIRDRLGGREDRFFATVFFGSGLLFLATLFVGAAMVGAIIIAFAKAPDELTGSAVFHLARAVAYVVVNIYAIKMAGVFIISTSTVALYTRFAPRWLAILGYALALLLLLASAYIDWIFVVFPAWVLLLSIYILLDNLRTAVPPAIGVSDRTTGTAT